jgi:hypothetical protein
MKTLWCKNQENPSDRISHAWAPLRMGSPMKGRGVKNFIIANDSAAEFLDEIRTKVLRVFLLAIHSHLYSFALRFLFLQTHAISYSF